ncbi:MAG: alpha/beta fold hydrolase [Candidatus Sericytochromatia bacterium]|nr:alpha/beta fold hydrolase [Candidatus Sericytochromatia bacterium]
MAFDIASFHDLYPFEHHFFERGGLRLHYLDEGESSEVPVVMLHGNPSWSFLFRDLVQQWRLHGRCIVPDHMGMGLSDKPTDDMYRYTLESRVCDLEALLDALQVNGPVSLVLHDWGGMIGMAWAARHPERVARIVALNTSAFGLPPAKPLPWALKVVRDTPLGAPLVQGLNAFASIASRVCTVRPLAPRVRAAYLAPYDTWAHRIATLRFVEDIPLRSEDAAWDLLQMVEESLPNFSDVPVFLGWGLRDFVFDRHFLAGWQSRFPRAETHAYESAGHYVLEDVGDDLIPKIVTFLRQSTAGGTS